MNEGAPRVYGGGGYGSSAPVFVLGGGERARHYALDGPPPPAAAPRRYAHRNKPDTAFGYDSDDSSLSSNASGSNKSSEKGDGQARYGNRVGGHGHGYGQREWRGRPRREPRRRIAPDRYLNAAYPFQVKFTPDELLNGSEWDTLSQEIWEKFVKSQQTEDTFRKKMNLWRYLYITIKSIVPRYGLYVVGSTMSGFGLDSSDMDLCLYVRPTENLDPRSHALLHLNYILSYIRNFDPNAELIQAKVPILKFRDVRAGLQVDLNCNNVVGIRNTNLLYCFSTMDWRVRPLVAVTKLWARAHHINDARARTLSSYSITLMVIHFLQCGTSPAVLPRAWCASGGSMVDGGGNVAGGNVAGGNVAGGWDGRRSANRTSLAELFLQMLKYYAEFPYSCMAVSVRAGRCVPVADCRTARAHKNDPHQWKLLCVEEPFELTNTARSVYDPETFERIVQTFRTSHRRLAATRTLLDAWPAAPAHTHTDTR